MTSAEVDFPRALLTCTEPVLIGVRHHSAAMAAAMPALLEAADPEVLLVELPAALAEWVPWLVHPDTRAPVAMALVSDHGLSFYPFAGFSPEWVAMRWAAERGIPVVPIDTHRSGERGGGRGLFDKVDVDRLWERTVETAAYASTPEQVRAAGLRIGWALRSAADEVSEGDLRRETHMRAKIAEHAGKRQVAVIGAFHAAALMPDPILWHEVDPLDTEEKQPVGSLVPYRDDLFDSRSGYPAGVRDPAWHEATCAALAKRFESPPSSPHKGNPEGISVGVQRVRDPRRERVRDDKRSVRSEAEAVAEAVAEREVEPRKSLPARDFAVRVCRRVRETDVGGSTPEAAEVVRMARGLARMRGLAVPGRYEVLEALQTVLGHGRPVSDLSPLGRAIAHVMIGDGVGGVPLDMPQCGLAAHTKALLRALKLPGPGDAARTVDVEPLRSRTGRRRHVALRRLEACHVGYGKHADRTFVAGLPSISERWDVHFDHAVEARLVGAGLLGVTLVQAATGHIAREGDQEATAGYRVAQLQRAAECGLPALFGDLLGRHWETIEQGGLATLLDVDRLLQRIAEGQEPGCPLDGGDAVPEDQIVVWTLDLARLRERAGAALERTLPGLIGSTSAADVRALAELVLRDGEGSSRLRHWLARFEEEGSPMIQGAAASLRVATGDRPAEGLAVLVESWLDGATDAVGRDRLAGRLQGALAAAAGWFEAHPQAIVGFARRIEELEDQAFLERLVAIRVGFSVLVEHERRAWLETLGERIDLRALSAGELSTDEIAFFAQADGDARQALSDYPLGRLEAGSTGEAGPLEASSQERDGALSATDRRALSAADRWRLILRQERDQLSGLAGRAAGALGKGGGKAGDGEANPRMREWIDELEAIFGQDVRDEIVAESLGDRPALAFELNPDTVRPSVGLLEEILPLAQQMSEAQLAKVRPMIRRVVEELTRQLARRMMPSLRGTPSPRATRRRTSQLHVPRTVKANLKHARDFDGVMRIVPERLWFQSRNRRAMHWEVTLVVDVSGSMEPSTIYAAIVSAILAGVPWVDLRFLAFNTEVIDFTDRAEDPLALLLGVEIGGGTNIGKALAYARAGIKNPHRSLVMVVSDFEEFGSPALLLREAREMLQSGVKVLGLAALDGAGGAVYNTSIAAGLAAIGVPVAALSPSELAAWIHTQTT